VLPEDVGQTQPVTGREGQLALTFDGRIDNREELSNTLDVPLTAPDAQFVLAAYEKWGEASPEHLLGDFAFALWDAERQHLFCARDIMGVRPFFYYLSNRLLLAASERCQLFTQRAPSREPNEEVIAGLMMLRVISQTETIHQDIHRLPPATAMIVTASNVRFRRYWTIQNFGPEVLRNDDESSDEFWQLLKEAVRCRQRSRAPVGVLLSGGVDSTAVASAAVDLARNPVPLAGRMTSYSLGFPGDSAADETELIQETIRHLGLDGAIMPPHSRDPGDDVADVRRYIELPDLFNDAFLHDIRRQAVNRGQPVLLTGMGGDEWFAGSPYAIAGRLRRGQVRQACREAVCWGNHRSSSAL
jgi:asparagine synthase (glutamine-hydrolysing)